VTRKWNLIFQIVLVFAAFAGSVYVALTPANSLMRWYNIDDAFYYYKVAQNVLAGNGFTFDGINLSNGFHPLWMVVCLVVFWFSRFNLILPLRILVIVSGLFNAATVLVLYRFLCKDIHPLAAFTAAFGWAVFPTIFNISTVHGMESSISVFFIVLLVKTASDLHSNRLARPLSFMRMLPAGLIAVLTILARLDNLFVVALVGVFLLFAISRLSKLYIYDLVVLAASASLAWFFRMQLTGIFANLPSVYLMVILVLLLKPMVFFFCGLYTGVNQLSKISLVLRELIATLLFSILLYGFLRVLYHFGLCSMVSRSIIIYDAFISFILISCLRLFKWKDMGSERINPFTLVFMWIKANWKRILGNGLGYATPIGLFVGAYMIFNKITFGTFTPVSGQIKTWWGTLPNTVYGHKATVLSILGLSNVSNYGPWSIVTAPVKSLADFFVGNSSDTADRMESLVFIILFSVLLIVLMAIFNANNDRLTIKADALFVPAVFIGCLIQFVYYALIGYQHTRGWYWLAEMLVVTLLVSLLLDALFTWLDQKGKRKIFSPILVGLMVVVLCLFHATFVVRLAPPVVTAEHAGDYIAEVREVESLTFNGARIGMTGGGVVAYFIQERTVVNLDGLINNPEYFHAMKNGVARDFLDALPLNFVYGQEYVVTQSDPYIDILDGRLVKIGVIKGFENFTLYKYVINQ